MDNEALSQGGNFNLVSAAIAAAAGNVNLNIAVGTNGHVIDGQFYTRAANASIAWTVSENSGVYGDPGNGSFTGQLGGSTRLFGLYMDTAGALSVKPGPIVKTSDLAAGFASLQFPSNQRGKVCFGFVRVAATAGTTFIPGVTAQNAAGVTTTYLNVSTIPAEPLRA
jgi:hypothetical protein